MIKKLTLCLTLFFLSLTGCGNEKEVVPEVDTYQKETLQYKTISETDANLISLDVYHYNKPTQSKPVVIWVHGGAWAVGDKANSLDNKLNLFSSLGYLFVSINYRLSPNPAQLTNPDRIKFPNHNDDVADAVKWIVENIQDYGGNADKMVLMGHSAGAHLVALSGTSAAFLPARSIALNKLKGIAAIDTEGYNVSEEAMTGNETYLNAFGANDTEWTQASPIAQVFSGTAYPKFFIAKRGSATRIGRADAFISKLQSVGVNVSQVTGNQYDHEGINEAIGKAGETAITEPLKVFLALCFQ